MPTKEEKQQATRVKKRRAAQEAASTSTSEQTNTKRILKERMRTRNAQVKCIHCTLSCIIAECNKMDSEVQRDGRILDLIDDAWKEDRLPYEHVTIPLNELPEPEQDNGGSTESVKEQEMKWSDLALQSLHENTPNPGS